MGISLLSGRGLPVETSGFVSGSSSFTNFFGESSPTKLDKTEKQEKTKVGTLILRSSLLENQVQDLQDRGANALLLRLDSGVASAVSSSAQFRVTLRRPRGVASGWTRRESARLPLWDVWEGWPGWGWFFQVNSWRGGLGMGTQGLLKRGPDALGPPFQIFPAFDVPPS